MTGRPRISIVTPSFNQARYIAETIESVRAQDWPDLEHIVMDGGSTDATLDVLRRYPHLRVVSERDRGQADAINKGFRLATGEIQAFLNSDDTLLPGALDRVAREIDPARGRHVVMGRCRFVDEAGRSLGFEHPSHFESHRRVLQVWKGHMIPQPSVFWTAEVWRTCGPMDEGLVYHLDYDLFCRFSRRYRFHAIDQVLSTYRLHDESKTMHWTEADRIADSIRLSRRYWGGPLSPLRWRLALSLAAWRFDRTGQARGWLRRAQAARRQRDNVRAVGWLVAGGALAPEVAFYVGVYPLLRDRAGGLVRRGLDRLAGRRGIDPETAVYLDRTEVWPDGWAGPRVLLSRAVPPGARTLRLQGAVDLRYLRRPFVLSIGVDGWDLGRHAVAESGEFTLEVALPRSLAGGEHVVAVETDDWFVPHRFTRNRDFRPLAFHLRALDVA
jgi:glycosyltransferase involved in cell wall biosynthesis